MREKIRLVNELDYFMDKISKGDLITLLRYGDGERMLIEGRRVNAQEGWHSGDGKTPLGDAIAKSMHIRSQNVFYGISCPCCNIEDYVWYMRHIESGNITFANLFVNANYHRFLKRFERIKRKAIVIGNRKGEGKRIGNLDVLDYYSVSDSCVDFYKDDFEEFVEKIISQHGGRQGLLYALSAGPLSEPLIHRLYRNNPENSYIDFGSCLDVYIHEKDTRPYVDPKGMYGKRNCWMYKQDAIPHDLDRALVPYERMYSIRDFYWQVKGVMNRRIKTLKEINRGIGGRENV